MPAHIAQITLHGGAVTPYARFRTDLEKHTQGLSECENFIPMPYGGVRKRPGTQYLTDLTISGNADAWTNAQMLDFRSSTGLPYILIFAKEKFTVWDCDNSTIIHTQDLTWPIPDYTDLTLLRFSIVNDVILITHPSFFPIALKHYSPTQWEFTTYTLTHQPYLDENLDENTEITVLGNPIAATWTTATAYTIGTHILSTDGRTEYTCILAHTSAATTEPGTGATWKTAWTRRLYITGEYINLRTHYPRTAWTNGTSYTAKDYVTHLGKTYRSKLTHTANPASEPATGALWTGVWAETITVFHPDQQEQNQWQPATTWEISQARPVDEYQVDIAAISGNNGKTSASIACEGYVNLQTFGTWYGIFTIQRSADGGTTWENTRIYEADGDRNISVQWEEPTPAILRILFTKDATTPSSGKQRAVLAPESPYVRGAFSAYTITDAYTALGRCTTNMLSGTSHIWKESAFSYHRGYPRVHAYHENRLYLAATTHKPTTLYASATEDWNNFRYGTTATDAFTRRLAADNQDPILWLASSRRLYLGTASAEYVVGSDLSDSTITPENFAARPYSAYGSGDISPLKVNDAVLFTERHHHRIREMAWIGERETYDSADLTRLNETITHGTSATALTHLAWQQSREPILWSIRGDGVLLSFSYIRAERIAAWSSHTHGLGSFTACTVHRTTEEDDELYLLIRTGDLTTLEKIQAGEQKNQEFTNYPATLPHYLDSWEIITHPGGTFTIPARLANNLNKIITTTPTDGRYTETITTSIATTHPAGTYLIGAVYTSTITTLPIIIQTQNGSSIGRKSTIHKVRAYLENSRGGVVKHPATPATRTKIITQTAIETLSALDYTEHHHFNPIPRPIPPEPVLVDPYSYLNNITPITTGWVEAHTTYMTYDPTFSIHHADPFPFTITALVAEFTLTEP